MARQTKADGFFIVNRAKFKETADFNINAMRASTAEKYLKEHPDHEVKYLPPEGFICIDADELDNREKYTKEEYPLEPIEYMEKGLGETRLKPFAYNTKNQNRKHYGFKVHPRHQRLSDKGKLHSSASKLYPGIDTRGFTKVGRDCIQGAIYLRSPGKVVGGRPTPEGLVAGIKTTCFAPISAFLPHYLKPTLRSGQEGEKTTWNLAIKFKKYGLTKEEFLEYCKEQAYIWHDRHNEAKCGDQGDNSPEPEQTAKKGMQLFRFKENFYQLKNGLFTLIEPGDLEIQVKKIPRYKEVKNKNYDKDDPQSQEYISVKEKWDKVKIDKEVYDLKTDSVELETDQNYLCFMNTHKEFRKVGKENESH